ncbi:hypothetical protein ACFYNO_06145 [Kitasatospora sp. NPDC006697]|uniref:hypothetical protein n=1 Tax=Kitasatospora sp. NPDC006697 TaxID=3364020 RepID=UPI0036A83130
MSSYHYIFIRSSTSEGQLVGDISGACGIPLRRPGGELVDWSAKVDRAAVELELSHDFEADHGIQLERYQSVLVIRDLDRDLERQQLLAERIFDGLAEVGRYELVLMFDIQEVIARSPKD